MPRAPSEQELRDQLHDMNIQKAQFQQIEDIKGEATTALAMADAHVSAGKMEDRRRMDLFLPMSKCHAAAAGANAQRAMELFGRLGPEYGEQVKAAEHILFMERIQWAADSRHKPFNYDYTVG
mmetsp:Transcript_25431/g.79242  ORF Transcript_25431/g.79242 Transcript_25431/m.79242 type:complete len:123 (-) Transcript_25431:107-475(-)